MSRFKSVDGNSVPFTQAEETARDEEEALERAKIPLRFVDQAKLEVGRRINEIASEWKQRNYLARVAELQDIQLVGGTLTTLEQTELEFVKSIWGSIKFLRTKSDLLETWILDPVRTSTDLAGLNVKDDVHWE